MLRLAALIGATLLLCGPAFINGGAILFPDTVPYVIDGDRLFHFAAPLSLRPVFYGLAIRFLHWDRSFWPVLLAQGLVVSHLLLLTLRAVGTPLRPLPYLTLMAALAVATPLAWTVSHVLADPFAAVLILSVFLLAFCSAALSRAERAYLVLLAAAAASFHLTHLAVALALAATFWLAWLMRPRWRAAFRPVLATAPPVLALSAMITFSLVLYQRITLAPNAPPFVLARLLADGPARDYLRQACPTHEYALCQYLDTLPPSEEAIIWRFLPAIPTADGKAIKAQADQVVRNTVASYPGPVIANTLRNFALQLVSIRATLDFDPSRRDSLAEFTPFIQREYDGTLQARGRLAELLPPLNAVHAAVALAGFAACLGFGAACLARGLHIPPLLVGTVLMALLANAFVSGALSGVFDRYQGRIIWLLPFAGVVAGLTLRQNRRAAASAATST